jgi:long-chain acyl-CoA synthetase
MVLKLDRGEIGVEYSKQNEIIACIGTAPLDTTLKANFENKYKLTLYESYGLTETLFLTTNSSRSHVAGSVGERIAGVDLDIASDGEIKVKVPWLFLGYSGFDKYSNKEFFKTGDLGKVVNDKLFITGRKKDIIIRGGVNVAPRKIEELLSSYFDEMVIIGIPDDILGEKIGLFYIASENSEDIKQKLNALIQNKLGKEYLIDYMKKVDQIPKTTNLKVDKLALLRQV